MNDEEYVLAIVPPTEYLCTLLIVLKNQSIMHLLPHLKMQPHEVLHFSEHVYLKVLPVVVVILRFQTHPVFNFGKGAEHVDEGISVQGADSASILSSN